MWVWLKKISAVFTKSKADTDSNTSSSTHNMATEDGLSDDPILIQENIRRAREKGFQRATPKIPLEQPKFKKRRIRKFFYRFVLSFLVLFHLLAGAVYFVLTPSFVEKQIIENFASLTNGTITLKVKKLNPFTGIWIEDLEIKNGAEFHHSTFIKLKKLKVSYSLPAFLWLNINIPEVGIYSPHIWIEQKNGEWNFAKLMKPSQEKKKKEEPEKPKPKKDVESKPITEIKLPISLRFFFQFLLDDFRFYVKAVDEKDKSKNFEAGLEGFRISTSIYIPPTKVIPLNPPTDIVKIFNKLRFEMNEDKPLKVWYSAASMESKPPLYVHVLTYLDKGTESFQSKFKVGMVKAPIRLQRKIFAPLDFLIEHDVSYDPGKDHLALHYFKVSFRKSEWVNLQGSIQNVQKNPSINMNMVRSDIILDELYPYFLAFTGDNSIWFGGKISLAPLKIMGTPQDLKVDGAVNLYNIRAKVPGLYWIYLSRLHLDYHTHLGGTPIGATYFRIDNFFTYVNGAYFAAKVNVPLRNNLPAGSMSVLFQMRNLRPENFLNIGVKGPVNLDVVTSSQNGLHDLVTKVSLNLPGFLYSVSESFSRPTNIKVNTEIFSGISASMKRIDVGIRSVNIHLANFRQEDAVRLRLDGSYVIDLPAGGPYVKGKLFLREFFFHLPNLFDTFPDVLRGNSSRSEQVLQQPVILTGETGLDMKGKLLAADGNFALKVPTFDIADLSFGFDIMMDQIKNQIKVQKVFAQSPSKHLAISVNGELSPKKVFDIVTKKYVTKVIPDIHALVAIDSPVSPTGSPQTFTIYKTPEGANFNLGGSIQVRTHVKDQDVDGVVEIKNFEFNDGNMTKVDQLNMNFPFQLKLDYSKKSSKLDITQADIIQNFNFTEKPNFTIRNVFAKHPSRNKAYAYLKDFRAVMFVRDNAFELKKMQASLLDGQLISQDTLFYLGNMDPKQMEYRAKFHVINIDMAALDQTLVKKQQEGGLLSAFVNLAGVNPAAVDPRGYIIVNKIGDEIADQLMRALNEKEGKSKLGIAQPLIGTASRPESFEFRLGDGNIYPKVKLYRGAISLAADLHPSELKYNRIPIQEFIAGLSK